MHRFLWFRNGRGGAACGDVALELRTPPRLRLDSGALVRCVEIEYVPRVNAQVLAETDPEHWRPMTDAECAAADMALEAMRTNALFALGLGAPVQ